jgi:hypothetical protein
MRHGRKSWIDAPDDESFGVMMWGRMQGDGEHGERGRDGWALVCLSSLPVVGMLVVFVTDSVGRFSGLLHGLQAAVPAATVPLGLAATPARRSVTARSSPDDALLPKKTAQLLAIVLTVIGCGAALFMRRTVSPR